MIIVKITYLYEQLITSNKSISIYFRKTFTTEDDKMWKITCEMFIVLSLWFLLANNITSAERILVITPTPFYSHQIVYRSLCLALNKRGHELIVVTPHAIKDSTLNNYTEIDLSDLNSVVKQNYNKLVLQLPMVELIKYVWKLSHLASIQIFNDPKFKELYRHDSNEKFDAIILEPLAYPSLSAIAYRFNASLIGKIISAGKIYKSCK